MNRIYTCSFGHPRRIRYTNWDSDR